MIFEVMAVIKEDSNLPGFVTISVDDWFYQPVQHNTGSFKKI